MATPNQPQMYCLGCGTNVTNKPADRRALQGSGSQQVVELWTTVCESLEDAERPSIDLNMLISGGGDPTRSGRMCRKCFYAYERYLKLHDSLQENLKKALDVLGVMPAEYTSQAKRPRLSDSISQLSRRRTQSQAQAESSSQSPNVAVSSSCQCSYLV